MINPSIDNISVEVEEFNPELHSVAIGAKNSGSATVYSVGQEIKDMGKIVSILIEKKHLVKHGKICIFVVIRHNDRNKIWKTLIPSDNVELTHNLK